MKQQHSNILVVAGISNQYERNHRLNTLTRTLTLRTLHTLHTGTHRYTPYTPCTTSTQMAEDRRAAPQTRKTTTNTNPIRAYRVYTADLKEHPEGRIARDAKRCVARAQVQNTSASASYTVTNNFY